jgi:hypothetical protein
MWMAARSSARSSPRPRAEPKARYTFQPDANFNEDSDAAFRGAGLDASFFDTDMESTLAPLQFERRCAELLRRAGWAAKTTKGSGDQGGDVLAERNRIRLVVQCKLYTRPVGNKAVQEVFAAKHHYKARLAAVVSNQPYTPGAMAIARSTGVFLLHISDLATSDRFFGDARVERRCPCKRIVLALPRGRSGHIICPGCRHRFHAVT